MTIIAQLQRLLDLGLDDLAGIATDDLHAFASRLPEQPGAVLVVHPELVPASRLATLLTLHDKPGFVVADLTDLDEFTPIDAVTIPDAPLYLLHDLDHRPRRQGQQACTQGRLVLGRQPAHLARFRFHQPTQLAFTSGSCRR